MKACTAIGKHTTCLQVKSFTEKVHKHRVSVFVCSYVLCMCERQGCLHVMWISVCLPVALSLTFTLNVNWMESVCSPFLCMNGNSLLHYVIYNRVWRQRQYVSCWVDSAKHKSNNFPAAVCFGNKRFDGETNDSFSSLTMKSSLCTCF